MALPHTGYQKDIEMTTILVDADFLDRLAFELSVNFERMLERRIDKLDIVHWVDCLMLDAQNDLGLQLQSEAKDAKLPTVQVIFLYSEGKGEMKNCLPAHLDTELNATATQTRIAEYLFASNKVEPSLTTMGDLFCESLGVMLRDEKKPRLLLVGDLWAYGDKVRQELHHATRQQDILLFTAGDANGFRCPQEMLSYSLMAAMGIRGDELE